MGDKIKQKRASDVVSDFEASKKRAKVDRQSHNVNATPKRNQAAHLLGPIPNSELVIRPWFILEDLLLCQCFELVF